MKNITSTDQIADLFDATDLREAVLATLAHHDPSRMGYTVADMRDFLLQSCARSHVENVSFTIKSRQTSAVRSALDSLKRAGLVETSIGVGRRRASARFYELAI